METSIEYISAGIVLCLILGVTAGFTNNMVSDRVARIEQTSDLKIADKIIDSLLLSQGNPTNWGQSIDPPTSMGLALGNAVQPYQLDRQKVSCLSNTSDNYIPASDVRDLLGLSQNYYLSIEIYPIYGVNIQSISNQKFLITVTNQWNVPVSTVNVTRLHIRILSM